MPLSRYENTKSAARLKSKCYSQNYCLY